MYVCICIVYICIYIYIYIYICIWGSCKTKTTSCMTPERMTSPWHVVRLVYVRWCVAVQIEWERERGRGREGKRERERGTDIIVLEGTRGVPRKGVWRSINMRIWACEELRAKHYQTSSYLRLPFLGTPLVPSRMLVLSRPKLQRKEMTTSGKHLNKA